MAHDNTTKDSSRTCHIVVALRRPKDNGSLKQLAFREVVVNDDVEGAVAKLEGRIKREKGTWRIHKTVNRRDKEIAGKMLRRALVDDFEKTMLDVDRQWKSFLLKAESRAERNILLDIDSEETFVTVENIIKENQYESIKTVQTPNGYHIVLNARKIDTRNFMDIADCDIKRDDYIFLKIIKNEEE